MSGSTLEFSERADWSDTASDAGDVVDLIDSRVGGRAHSHRDRRGFFCFITELRRRKVCRAATAYCITLWLTCQVVEVVEEPLGLPDWTLELVIVLGLVCFPIALILSWLFEVTPDGLVLDNDSHGAMSDAERLRSRFDQVIDFSLLAIAVAIGGELAISSFATSVEASPAPLEEFYVGAFAVVSESNSQAFSDALRVELQHELATLPTVTIIAPADPSKLKSGSRVSGSVSVTDEEVQVTALVICNQTERLTWSKVLQFPIKEAGGTPRSIARGIVTALEHRSSSDTVSGG